MNTEDDLNSALALHRSGRLDAAAAIYRRLYERDSNDADACYGLGTVLMAQKELSQAAELLDIAVRLQPDVPEFLYNHALALDQLDQGDQARASLLRAAELCVSDPELLPAICRKLIDLGLDAAAQRFLLACNPVTPEVLRVLAQAQGASGHWGGALLTLRRLSTQTPDDASVWQELATAAGHRHEYEAAIDAYETYMRLKPPDGDDLLAFADLLLLARKPEEADAALKHAMEAGADYSAAHIIAAKCARLAGDYAIARKHLQQAVEKRPTFGDAWQLLLETETEETLPQFAADCARHADDDNAKPRDRILLALTAGRANEKLRQYTEAFQYYRTGNDNHKALLDLRLGPYDTSTVERFADKIICEFDEPLGSSSGNEVATAPIFILGMPRSGTTLVERILGCLDGVVVGGESEAIEVISTQHYWSLEQGRAVPPRKLQTDSWDSMAREYWRRSTKSACRLTDKMPHNFWHLGFIRSMFPAAPIIYMRRDPRDVCLSIYTRMFADGHRYACDLEWLAHYYSISVSLMEHWKAVYGDRILEVIYEDLVADPTEQTRNIAAFCELQWDPACLEFHKQDTASFTFSELQVREPINTKGIGAWRNYESQLAPLLAALKKPR